MWPWPTQKYSIWCCYCAYKKALMNSDFIPSHKKCSHSIEMQCLPHFVAPSLSCSLFSPVFSSLFLLWVAELTSTRHGETSIIHLFDFKKGFFSSRCLCCPLALGRVMLHSFFLKTFLWCDTYKCFTRVMLLTC